MEATQKAQGQEGSVISKGKCCTGRLTYMEPRQDKAWLQQELT